MSVFELFLLSTGLAMDAFAAAAGRGLSVAEVHPAHLLSCGFYFGAFQALMPLLGGLLGTRFQSTIARYDHWIAFLLLGWIGLNMLRAGGDAEEVPQAGAFEASIMLPLALATSIDALAAGVSFAFLQADIARASITIGLITCAFSAVGVWLGGRFGLRWRTRAQRLGGAILMLMGVKILLEHQLR